MAGKYIIGIDPDKEKSGVGIIDTTTRELTEISSFAFPELLDMIHDAQDDIKMVVVEAGWLVKKSNFHDAQGHRAEKIAKDVGANHETGRKIIEMCRYWHVPVIPHMPLIKCWKGHDRKITHEELVAITHLQQTRSNQDARDAGLLAWAFAGYPIRIKP